MQEFECFFTVPGIEVNLATATLLRGKGHLMAQGLQNLNQGPTRPGEESIVETGDEKGYSHSRILILHPLGGNFSEA
jgi:hypothetical protein